MVPGRVGIVGLGLVGGSVAKALAAAGTPAWGCDLDASTERLALVETIAGILDDAVLPTCELVVLAGWPGSVGPWLEANAARLAPGAIVMDVAGVKRGVCRRARAACEGLPVAFVGCHPMAGSHRGGFEHARADLFRGAPMAVVPPALDDPGRADVLLRLEELLAPCGFGSWSACDADEHDAVVAYTSQLAHLVSSAYAKSPTALRRGGLSAGSWRDLTRVAELSAPMWAELFEADADHLLVELDRMVAELGRYRDAIAAGDHDGLVALLEEGTRMKREADAL